MTDKQPAALETKNERSESKPNTSKRYKTEKAELRRRIVSIVLLLVFVPAVIAVGMLEFNDRYYYITASLIIICSFIPFLMLFEKRRPRARELVVIAVMTALGVAGRAAFYMLPQFKPIAATVIITGVSLGCEAGFITGALTAFVSNMFFGQGPWTPWQMFALGLLGFISGLVFRKDIRTKTQRALLCLYGALSTFFIYGGIMDSAYVLMAGSEPTLAALLAAYASGLPFNLIFAGATVVFLLVLTRPILNKLRRIKKKYGLLTD